jgi:signal transduction histidine kinase
VSSSGERTAALEAATRRYSEELSRERDPIAKARVLSDWGEASRAGGRPAEAVELLERALAALGESVPRRFLGLRGRGGPPPPPAEAPPAQEEAAKVEVLSEVCERLAAAYAASGEVDRAPFARRRSLAHAARLGPGRRYARTLGAEALAIARAGDPAAALEHAAALERLAAATEAGDPLAAAIARRHQALVLLELGRLDGARTAADAARTAAGRSGEATAEVAALLAVARVAAFGGRPRETLDAADAARRLAREAGALEAEDEADALAGIALVLTGDLARGRRLIDRARSRAIEGGAPEVERVATCMAGFAAVTAGDWRSARAIAARLGREPGPSLDLSLPALLDAEACLVGVEAGGERRVVLGEATGLLADAAARVARTAAACQDLPALAARAQRIGAAIAAERNDPGALAALERAAAAARASAGPIETARALMALALHAARIEGRNASELLREAERTAAEAGALALAGRARALADAAERLLAEQDAAALPATDEIGREQREIASLHEVGRAVSSILELEPLLERIMDEIVALLGADRGFVMLYDEPAPLAGPAGEPLRHELRVRVARNLDRERLSSAEFQVSRSVVAEVERTREPIVVSDASHDDRFQSSLSVVNLQLVSILCFPLKTTRSFLGVVYADSRSVTHLFRRRDLDLTLPFVAQAAVAIENAFAYERIRELYEETLSVARAREKVLNHLSHELKTPIAIVRGALVVLAREAGASAAARRALERGERNLARLVDIQTAIADIYRAKGADADTPEPIERIDVAALLEAAIAGARTMAAAAGRSLEIVLEPVAAGCAIETARRPLTTALESLLKNAVENTPDEGRIEVSAAPGSPDGDPGFVTIAIRDHGVGVTAESRKHLFDGFYHTQETESYSSRRPYEFDAGGKGLDLLRVRTFALRYGWEIGFDSERCRFIPRAADACPGRISACPHCRAREDCLGSGGTVFRIAVPAP